MRLATWNVNSVRARLPRLLAWLTDSQPDVLCLQETKAADPIFPFAEIQELGYDVAHHGTGRWNGVAILSRVGLSDVARGFPGDPGFPDPEPRAVGATCAGIRVWSLYVPNGRGVDDPHYAYKLAWLAALRSALARTETPQSPLVVCGDFNVAPTDDDVWSPEFFATSTHVTPAERQAVAELSEAFGLHDLHREHNPAVPGTPGPFSYWDYRAGDFHNKRGMRIDLVLASAPVAAVTRSAVVDRDARKGKGPSDHAPVVVDLDWDLDGNGYQPVASAQVTGG